ncbi:MAG: hypothetical protein WBM00_12320 [Solirubrobacterales bacterium]
MKRIRRFRPLLIAATGALLILAMLAMPGVAAAKHRDRNHDGIPDRWEKRHHLSLKVNQANLNQDHEGLNNLEEFENQTNPRQADTDSDGLNDAQEVEVGDNPNDNDTDNDGVEDGQENAGTVESFDGTTLTIKLFDGSTMSGQLTESTEIECSHQGDEAQTSEDGQNQSGDSSGEDSSGDEPGNDGAQSSCTTANLVAGTPVREAELDATPSGAVFHSVELG